MKKLLVSLAVLSFLGLGACSHFGGGCGHCNGKGGECQMKDKKCGGEECQMKKDGAAPADAQKK